MTLGAGTKLGPYEILAPIGAGGMGEVYRAKDPRLRRDVAIKVLPSSFSQDAERLRRFEQEAQAAGALNHPNITAVYELGSHEGSPYIVTELLEGETLRGRLSGGALPVRKATDYAIQTAKGLAAAHEKGIVHRDLKPENLFVTSDGRVKILDFGLAKLTQAEGATGPQTNLPTLDGGGTEPGVVLGTLGYMAPEQVKGKAADGRSDIFAFGAILYEMLSGSRAFYRDTAAETMSAILREDPPDLSATNKNVQPGLERVVRHCLEKSPEERFHSAHDLAFDLEALSGKSGASATTVSPSASRVRWLPIAAAAVAVAGMAATFFLGRGSVKLEPATFKQLTFRRGTIWSARFGPDGKTILSSAAWDGRPAEVFMSTGDAPESRPFGAPGADVAAVSASGDVALLLNARSDGAFARVGTLARVSAAGGVPRELFESVQWADFSRDGKELAIVRTVDGKSRLEFPPGKVLFETMGFVGDPRFSPKGDRIAFVEHPVPNDDGGTVAIVDLAGKKKTVSGSYATIAGLAWSPDGSEVWYTAAEVGANRALHAVSASGGQARTLARIAGSLTLRDAAPDGRTLVTHDSVNLGIMGRAAGAPEEIDLSWFDWTLLNDLSDDGRRVLFTETGEGGGAGYSTFVRGLDGSPAVRIGEGVGFELSPDGKSVLALVGSPAKREIVIYPTGPGEIRKIPSGGVNPRAAGWVADGRSIFVGGRENDRPPRDFVFDLASGKHRAVSPEGYRGVASSGDGKRFITRGPDNVYYFGSTEGGEPVRIPGLEPRDVVAEWADDGRIFVQKPTPGQAVLRLVTLDPVTGRQQPWRDLSPQDTTGIHAVRGFVLSRDGAYAYGYYRTLSTLFLVGGAQ